MRISFENILSYKTVAGVNIHYSSQEEFVVYVCLLEKKKGALHSVLYQVIEQSDLARLSDIIPKGTAIALSFSGVGVLNKDFSEATRDENIKRFFPENNQDDIYGFETDFRSVTGLSICRKETIDSITRNEVFKNLPIVAVQIGSYIASMLWNLELTENHHISINQATLELIDNNSFSLSTGNKDGNTSINLGDEQVGYEYVLAYVSALNVHLGTITGNFIGNIPKDIQSDYKFKKIIDSTRFVVLGILLGILSINFVVFENFRNKNVTIQEQLQLNNGTLVQRDSLRSVLKAKEDFLSYIGNNRTYFSLMLDEIAGTVPGDIKLNELKINPLIDKARKEEPLEFRKKIEISGFSKNTLILNQWERKLADISWVKEAEVINFAQNKDRNAGEFLVELTLIE